VRASPEEWPEQIARHRRILLSLDRLPHKGWNTRCANARIASRIAEGQDAADASASLPSGQVFFASRRPQLDKLEHLCYNRLRR